MRKPVLTIFYQYNPWNSTIGGIQTLINSFIKYAPSEFEVRVVGTGTEKIGKWHFSEFAGREIKFLPILRLENDNIRSLIPTTVKYTAALMGHSFASDFMHFHRLEPTLATLNWSGEKTLFIHNDIQTQMSTKDNKKAILWRRFPQAYFALESFLIKQFSHILACNTDATKLYSQRYPQVQNRIAYIKNSYDNEMFYPLEQAEKLASRRSLALSMGLDRTTKFLLFAGRLHPQKDPLMLLRAIALLNQSPVHLLIAGDGELTTAMKSEIQRLNISHLVTMLGAVSQTELARLHRICDAFVLSSAYEGLPLVVLEALASGTPVVTTQCGETPKILANNSGVVCQRTPSAIAQSLLHVLSRSQDYPVEACVQTARPYAASIVMQQIYHQMWQRWQHTLYEANT